MSEAHRIPPYRVVEMSRESPGFYEAVGPFLSRREVVSELGSPVWDDDGKSWWVARSDAGETLGLVGIHRGTLCSFYVEPGSRGQAVGYAILRSALAGRNGRLKATATAAGAEMFHRFGFEETGTRGRFSLMAREGKE